MFAKIKAAVKKAAAAINGMDLNQNATVKSKGFLRRVVALLVLVLLVFAIFILRMVYFQLLK